MSNVIGGALYHLFTIYLYRTSQMLTHKNIVSILYALTFAFNHSIRLSILKQVICKQSFTVVMTTQTPETNTLGNLNSIHYG